MNPHTIASLGGPYEDEEAVVDPTSEVAAAFLDRALEDVAQMTNAIGFSWYSFTTTATAAPVTLGASTVSVSGLFGSGTAQKPTVAKTATGVYTLTWPAIFDDALVGVTGMSAVSETQTVAFTFAAQPNVLGATNGYARVATLATNVVTINVYDTTDAASDLGGIVISGYLR